jgi:hypothetical protein
MKCELCHQKEAETAILVQKGDEEQELYVCRACASQERVRRQKKSQRTRKTEGLPPGVSISVTGVGPEAAPPPQIIEAIMSAMQGMVTDLESAGKAAKTDEPKVEKEPDYAVLPCTRVPSAYRVGGALHLEGLNLIGELPAVKRAFKALRLRLVGETADVVKDTGHVFRVAHAGTPEMAERVLADLLAQERHARVRLFEEMPRVFEDAVSRSIAILKSCRLLSEWEFLDIISPLRIAAELDFLDNFTREEALALTRPRINLPQTPDPCTIEEQREKDRRDAALADKVNRRFKSVRLNARGKDSLT